MNFVSIIFAVFFSLVLLSQLLLRRARARQWALLIASYYSTAGGTGAFAG